MNCCINCFQDENIIDFINRDDYILGDCDFCNSKNIEICDFDELCEHFKFKLFSLFQLYDSIYVTHFKFDVFRINDTDDKNDLLTLIQNDWNLFYLEDMTEEGAYILLNEFKSYINIQYTTFRNVSIDNMKEKVWVRDMTGFFQKKDWDIFKEILAHDFRFFPFKSRKLDINIEESMEFELFSVSSSYLYAESILYRARIHSEKTDIPFEKEKMLIPANDILTNGRSNPIGINYLYLADDIDTVLAELRAWKNGQISIATIEICEDLFIVDLTKNNKHLRYNSAFDMKDNLLLQSCLAYNDLMDLFVDEITRPINPNEAVNEYILTQFICEKIKTFYKDDENPTFDGIKFNSSVGNGVNYVLFSDKRVIVKEVDLYKIEDIEVHYNYKIIKNVD